MDLNDGKIQVQFQRNIKRWFKREGAPERSNILIFLPIKI